MKLILDANIIFSCLISGKKLYIDILTQHQCCAPDFIFKEIDKYESKILHKSRSTVNFKEFAKEIFGYLVIIPKIAIEDENWKRAAKICKDIDEKDTAYVALSMELDLPFITRDKKLYKKLREKKYENIILFDKFLEIMNQD